MKPMTSKAPAHEQQAPSDPRSAVAITGKKRHAATLETSKRTTGQHLFKGEKAFAVDGPAGPLESIYTLPDDAAEQQGAPSKAMPLLAIICHPNPLEEGTMHNKVVVTVARTLRKLNIPSLRFNFRGIGQSGGEQNGVEGSLEDAQAVLRWATQHDAPKAILWAGFSYGSYVAYKTAQTCPILGGLICIAPPVDRLPFDQSLGFQQSPLVVFGMEDEIVPAQQMLAWARQTQPACQLVTLPEVGHFFHGKLSLLQKAVSDYVQGSVIPHINRDKP